MDQMTSDQGAQFLSQLWAAIFSLLGRNLHPTMAYHPQSNGIVERLHRTLKALLKACLTNTYWIDQLPWVLLGIRTTPKEDLNASPVNLVYGESLTEAGDFLPDAPQIPVNEQLCQLHAKVDKFWPTPTSAHGADQIKTNIPNDLSRLRPDLFLYQHKQKSLHFRHHIVGLMKY